MTLDWVAENFRVTAFAAEPLHLTEKQWQTVTGQDEAESRTQVPGGRAYSGPALGGYLLLTYSGNRTDCVLSPTPDKRGDLQSVGPWRPASETFSECTQRLLVELGKPIVRLAFGAVLLLREENREAGYRRLDDLLTSVTIKPGMRDFNFRVNWPRRSTVIEGLTINRLTSWAVVRIAQAAITLGPAGLPQFQSQTEVTGEFVRLEIDNNTAAGQEKPFDQAQLAAIYGELISLADEVAQKGESE
jgi:hypothetical protein